MKSWLIFILCFSAGIGPKSARVLHTLTASDKLNFKMFPMQMSALHVGYDVNQLGFGTPSIRWGRKLGWKLNQVNHLIRSLPSDDVVLLVDAFDVLFVDPPQMLLGKFEKYVKQTGKTILIAAEEYNGGHPGFRAADHPKVTSRWRYINSGLIIGLVSGWRLLFTDPPPDTLPARYVSDQDWIIDVYLNTSGLGGFMGIDSNCEMFQVTCSVDRFPVHESCPFTAINLNTHIGQLTNNITSSHPSILHLVGPAHWPIKYSVATILHSPRLCTCTYYEVARSLMIDAFQTFEGDPAWSGQPYSVICTDDSLILHVVLDASLRIGLWVVPGLLLFSYCLMRRHFSNKKIYTEEALKHV